MASSSFPQCALGCGKPVNSKDPDTWKLVTGWVGGPRKDSMRLRTDVGCFAHHECVMHAQAGQDPASQPTLDDEASLTGVPGAPVPEDLFTAPPSKPTDDEINQAFQVGDLGKTYLQEF